MTSHLTRPRLSPELHCQQHAMALDSYSYDCCVLPPLDWDWDWDELHTTLGLGGAGTGGGGAAQEPSFFFPATPGVESPGSSEASSGYLQDAVADWSGRCSKRQRMATATPPPPRRPATVGEDLQCLLESFWDSSAEGEGDGDGDGDLLPHDLNTTIPEAEIRCSFVSGEDGAGASGREEQRGPSAQVLPAPAAQRGGGGEEAARAAAAVVVPPPRRPRFPAAVRAAAPLQKGNAGADHAAARRDDRSRPGGVGCCEGSRAGAGAAATTAPGCACPSLLAGEEEKRGVGVLYPFAVVKPLGLDDGRMTTLDDVNKRILKRPTRPVRHPVGPFACGPAVMAHGLGLSGKAVVSLTKIRTGGKGTITIIRTRG
ncbi:hypothetical protein SEVIR_1G342600v4 [Setaria viridis]|uniref:Protein XRI1 n=1 Tax=Setaria viridis TaxID=4556 RepID=A0A4U6WK05_SETVI|nr:uncharacterized protein LOC117839716 isoform X1 [Setaria viridis]TKW41819.1 hypothetical protein SEVIR_1G342600v2 [Setaria viridis]